MFTCRGIYNNFTSFFFYFTPVVLDLCFTILRKHPSNKKCNPLIFGIIDKIIAEILVDSEIEKDVATNSTTDDGIPLASLNADNFKLPSPGCALQSDVASIQLSDPASVEAPMKESKEHQEQFKRFLDLVEWANEYPPICLEKFEYL